MSDSINIEDELLPDADSEDIVEETTTNSSKYQDRRNEVQHLKQTRSVDKLLARNRNLQKDLDDSEREVDELEKRLDESSLRISKNLFYVGLIVVGYFIYTGNSHLSSVNESLIEMRTIAKEYKAATEKSNLYNEILEKKLNISDKKK